MSESGAPFSPGDPVTALHGVGKARAEILAKIDINAIEDLLWHFPRRYEDRRRPVPVGALKDGEAALARVHVRKISAPPSFVHGKGAPRIPMKVHCFDESGELVLLFFNARWLSRAFSEGGEYWVYGTPRRDLAGATMTHPDFEEITNEDEGREDGQSGKGIVPVYPLTAGITQKYLRSLVRAALPAAALVDDALPSGLTRERRLAPASYSLANIHFPEDEHGLNAARYRLVYEELFLLQMRLLYARGLAASEETGGRICAEGVVESDAASLFPYELTGAQSRAISEIRADMASVSPMNRLLQGDVGSGKTAVAAAAALFAAKSGYQTAVMAPTEILASQHAGEFALMFKGTNARTALLTSGLSAAEKREVREALKSGSIDIVIGTHALIEPDVVFSRLGLVVTDEQHRFGVRQRLGLQKKGTAPDTLVMTATPIPRTLALMLYADLDVSVLDEMPPGRKAVATRFVNSAKRDAVYDFAEREMEKGRQVYVVAPMIGDEGDMSGEGEGATPGVGDEPPCDGDAGVPMATALGLGEELAARFPHRCVKALHGRMKTVHKDGIMREFAAGDIDMLVSTVVIEVGVNIPNATMMIVENSERFGLAQLHQLRGRVGRGADKSYCVLISDSESELSIKRGEALASEQDGFRIAELDLSLRGPGDLFGVRQHGLPEFKIADPAKHIGILAQASEDAKALLACDPGLELEEHAALRRMIGEGKGS
ncbi:MAG: ATP-dependent DNA helicase RecG [Clostridiales bacterium]|nr:ATP-dependent DNA helicase RecG [Clostridiales bacterium]